MRVRAIKINKHTTDPHKLKIVKIIIVDKKRLRLTNRNVFES